MKDTGIVRRIDNLGRVVLPKETRKLLDIKEGDPMEFYIDGENIVLTKYVSHRKCIFCGSDKNVIHHVDKPVCTNCIKTMGMRLKYD